MNAVKTHPALKASKINAVDKKHTGEEPQWNLQPESDRRIGVLAQAFSWYNYYCTKKDAKGMIANWLDFNDRKQDAKTIRSLPDSAIRLTPAWLCRMNLTGLVLLEHEEGLLETQISDMLGANKSEIVEEIEPEESGIPKLTIQDHLREKAIECAGELEGMFDDFIIAGAKMSAEFKPLSYIRGLNISPNMINIVSEPFKTKLQEFNEVLEGKDADLVEGYSQFTKPQIKNMIKFCENLIADCSSYVQLKKVERKPRAKKAISPEKQSAKFKYLKEFTDLKLKSESPAKLVGASEAWLYDTKKRKLIYVIADAHIGTFTVKGSALIGFDEMQTVQKTLRKPEEQLKGIIGAGKPAARKAFKDIKSTETKYNGRGNENLIIIKAW